MKDEVNVTKYIVEFKDERTGSTGYLGSIVDGSHQLVEEAPNALRFDTSGGANEIGGSAVGEKLFTHYRVLEFTVVQTYTLSYGVEWSPRDPEEYWMIQVRHDGADEDRNFLISYKDGEMFTGIDKIAASYPSELIAIMKAFSLFENENVKEIRTVHVVDDSVTYDEWRDYLGTRGQYKMLDAADRGFT